MQSDRNRVCPVELAGSLDNRIRRWLQNPEKIVTPFVREGMTVMDVGCGPGFFSIEMAKLVGPSGKVIAADLQEGMLRKLRHKIQGSALEARITLLQCERDKLNIPEQVDFILAFYMVHEVPDKGQFFKKLKSVLKAEGQMLLVEPKLFHVSKKGFQSTTRIAENSGFKICPGPKLHFSWSAILKNS